MRKLPIVNRPKTNAKGQLRPLHERMSPKEFERRLARLVKRIQDLPKA